MTHAIITPLEIIRLMREASGESMMTCKRAWKMATTELGGDYLLALLVVSANSLAINVKDAPDQTPGERRKRWNLEHAHSMREMRATSTPAYAKLAQISTPYALNANKD